MKGTIAIMGAKGRMGTMLSTRLTKAGFTVKGADISDKSLNADNIKNVLADCRAVIIAIPAKKMQEHLKFLSPHLNCHLLMDICSVKTLPMQWMEEAYDGPVIGSHPLFGPDPYYSDLKVTLVKGSKARQEDVLFAEKIYKSLNCTLFWCSAKVHDKSVAMTQSLSFAVNAAFLSSIGSDPSLCPFITPSFKRQLLAAKPHITHDAEMFIEFSSLNPFFSEAIEKYIEKLKEASNGELSEIAKSAGNWYKHSPRS